MKFNKEFIDKIKSYAITILISLGVYLCLNFFISLNFVNGASMNPTLSNNQILLGEKLSVKLKNINRGDIVTATTPFGIVIKRVIGLPGESIKFEDGSFYINNIKLKESTTLEPLNGYRVIDLFYERNYSSFNFTDITLKDDEYFIVGDNRNNSSDSRVFGPITNSNIISKIIHK